MARSAAAMGVSQKDYIAGLIASKGCPRTSILDMCPNGNRGPSILAWACARNIRSWVALDDAAPEHMAGAEFRTVRTDPERGLTDADVERAAEMLLTDMF